MIPFIVAELSANHLGSLDRALRIVDAAARAGADAIKLQTWSPDTMCVSDYEMKSGPWQGQRLRDLYEAAHTPWDWHKPIFGAARSLGLVPFSAAFDPESVDFLEELEVDRHKVASFELTDYPLIRYMAGKGKPMILSTGMASQCEIDKAALTACYGGAGPLTLLRCVSEYPANPNSYNVRGRITNSSLVPHDRGLSDHSLGCGVAAAAVAHGAVYVEKHLTLSRADGGPDAAFSMEPDEFARMVQACREAYDATSSAHRIPEQLSQLRRSLWVVEPIPAGKALVLGKNVRTARPAMGLPCDTVLVGRYASRDLRAGEPLTTACMV